MLLEQFVETIGFFGQYKDFDRCQVILWVYLAMTDEMKNGLTQAMLAEYFNLSDDTIQNRKYKPEVWIVQKAACMQFLRSNSTKEVLEYIVKMATWKTDFNPAPAQKLYLQFIEWRSEKIALDSDSPITIVFGGWKSSFVNSDDEDDKPKKLTPVKTVDTTKWSVKKKISRLVDTSRWKKK
jgi:hypothetical protein